MHGADKARKIHGTGFEAKVAVMGLLERHGEAMVVRNNKHKSLRTEINAHVESKGNFMGKPKTSEPSEEYRRFENLARQLISVPKSELDKREAEYQKQKKSQKKRRTA